MNAKYFNDVFPLESVIKQLDTDLFDGVNNVFMDLLVDRDDPPTQKYNAIIDMFIESIKTKVDKILKDLMFKKLFEGSVASNSSSSASSVTNTGGEGDGNPVDTTATTTAAGSGATNTGATNTGASGMNGGKRRSRSNRTSNHVVSDEKQYNIRLV